MTDSPALARLRGNHYNLADWNAATNPGGMGGDGHRLVLVPPKAPQVATHPVMVDDLVTLADEVADNAVAAAAAASGGASAVTLSGPLALTSTSPRVQGLNPGATGRDVTLPDATTLLSAGGPVFIITNTQPPAGTGAVLTVKNAAGTVLRHLDPGDTAHLCLLDRSSAAGAWLIDVIASDPYDRHAALGLSADVTLSSRTGRSLSVTPTLPGRAVYLPDATTMPHTGGPIFNITNSSTSLSFQIRGATGALLDEVQPGQTVLVWLRDKASAAGAWGLMVADRPSGTAFSPRQVLDTTFLHNHQISPTSRADKALWSYSRNGTLCVRVLTIAGQTVTPGPEQLLGPGPLGGMALALSDTYGVACWATLTDTFHRGFTIDLSTGACTPTGTAVGWGMSSSERDIRMSKVPGSSTHCLAIGRNASMHARLIGFNGTSLSQSPVLVTPGTSANFGCHDVLALNSSWAAIFLADTANSGRLSYRQIDMDVAAMTLANGGTTQLSTEGAAAIICARLASGVGNYWLIMSSAGSDIGACLRYSADNATGRYVLSPSWSGAASSGRPGACIVWPGTQALTAFYTLFDLGANAHRAVIQDLTWDITRNNGNTWENNAFRPAGPPRNLSAVTGPAVNNVSHEHWSIGAALSSTTGLFIYSDATNANFPTAILVERIA